jgi:peptidoglycan hydrolase-like protein with peptidoglycan-binding domain
MLSRQQFGSRILYQGLQGEDVKELQSKLESLGYDVGPIDGIFGPLTERAVRKFQKDNKLAVDGIVGQETFATLEKLVP